MSLPELKDNCCPKCKSPDLLLCQDQTLYRDARFKNGCWNISSSRFESIDGEDSMRLMCTECGEYMEVPKELT